MEVINIDVMCYRYHLIYYCRFLYRLVAEISFNFFLVPQQSEAAFFLYPQLLSSTKK